MNPVLVLTPGTILEALFFGGLFVWFVVIWVRYRLKRRRAIRRIERDGRP